MKNCPFCHEDNIEVIEGESGFKMICNGNIKIGAKREKCGTYTLEYKMKKELIKDWDKRDCLYLRKR